MHDLVPGRGSEMGPHVPAWIGAQATDPLQAKSVCLPVGGQIHGKGTQEGLGVHLGMMVLLLDRAGRSPGLRISCLGHFSLICSFLNKEDIFKYYLQLEKYF